MHDFWPDEMAEEVKKSSVAEPAAVYAAAKTFINPGSVMKVKHIGGNIGTRDEINKGYSTKKSRFLAEVLAHEFPGVTFSSDFTAGTGIPTDEISRARQLVRKKLDTLAGEYSVSEIRDWACRSCDE